MNLPAAQSELLANSLARELAGEVYVDPYRRALYSTDASIYQIQPLAVVLPRRVDDVVVAHQVAARHSLAVIPRGGGTSLSGQSIGAGIVIDFSKYLNNILDIDERASVALVEPGVVLDQLNAALAPRGLEFGPDVATSNRANIGGMIGNNSAGSHSIRQGKTVDHVLSLDTVLADGSRAEFGPLAAAELVQALARTDQLGHIYRELKATVDENREEILARYPPILRRVSGYNLDEFVAECRARVPQVPMAVEVRRREAQRFGSDAVNAARLLVGAEGSLAAIVRAAVHVVPAPAARGIVVLHFDSLAAAVGAIEVILSCQPSAAELFDGLILRLAEKSLEYRHYLDFVVGHPQSLVLVEFSGDEPPDVERQARLLVERTRGCAGLAHALLALEPARCAHVWACRKAALPLLLGEPGKRRPVAFVEDAAVDPRRLGEFVARFQEIMSRHGTSGAFYGHASVGCLHVRPVLDLAEAVERMRLERISEDVCDLVLEFHGAMSGEHGDGLARSYLNERLFGPRLYQAFRRIKAAFDPGGRMNPGKVVNGPRPAENLRATTGTPPPPVATTFDFRHEGSLYRAAELCNGAGVCRKLSSGTMCPSFMVTRDEEHSTRGRAGALRLVLSGMVPETSLTSPRLFETFDLCLQCKGCKAECPSNVDVAKMKMEFLDHYYRHHGAPLGVRMMAHAATVHRWGSALAPLSNWLMRIPGAGLLRESLAGIDRRRSLPPFERENFRRWFRRRKDKPRKSPQGVVVLLDDCLNGFCDTGVLKSSVALLEAAGYEVVPAGLWCCGRTLASKGFLEETRRLAAANVAQLAPWARRGAAIVGCEPSCVGMLTDEYVDLLPGEDAAQVAGSTVLIETFLLRAGVTLPGSAEQAPSEKQRFLLHGHCHQKALFGVKDTMSLLAAVPGATVKAIDSGCCGMAGSFGYEHFDLSMQIGERMLFPAVRSEPQATIVAPGFSCRQQIAHGTGRRAKHPAEVLAARLARDD